ncbi:MAG: malto-oligosyltrehalose synthase [Proteobacteria bacterium]|nr:malto-oligosyltrehalose synthase [Pseudomonadota bacterium]
MTRTIHSVPRATMRLQLHKGFTFYDAALVVPYLAELGVSHAYTSPILTALPGSIHGYDVIDPTRINPELGGDDGLRHFVSELRGVGLGLIVDIVPNHMAVGASENPWWADVLRNGPESEYAGYFDIDWHTSQPGLRNKLLAPFLGRPYGEALADGELRLNQDHHGRSVVDYFGNQYPIRPQDEAHIQEAGLESFNPANQSGRDLLHALLERQHYRLAWWTTAGDEINWRRFFDINGLAGLRAEVPEVFEATHATLFRLYTEGLVDGFRIDHVDGLSDPPGYCRRLRTRLDELAPQRPSHAAQGRAYIVVEKILAHGEMLPADWEVDGTTGYDFMNQVSAVQHDRSAAAALRRTWQTHTGRSAQFSAEEVIARKQILARGFEAPLEATAQALHDVAWSDPATRDVTAPALRRGVAALLAHFPAYRGYNAGVPRTLQDQRAFEYARVGAKDELPASSHPVLDRIDDWLCGAVEHERQRDLCRKAATLFHQLSAPIAAKAVEDTAFYRYGPLLSRNDVGFDASRLGGVVEDFHAENMQRLKPFPDAMLATATHDHKRGEDTRARLAIISEIPQRWADFLLQMLSLSADVRPDPADEIMLYQTLIGVWPLNFDVTSESDRNALIERVTGWQQKALREAKLHSDWLDPDNAYESVGRSFLSDIMKGGERLDLLARFVERVAAAGALNGLVQAVLKLTVPGIPDFFQGTEFWDFSLVDPDNRRPVDFDARRAALSKGAPPAMAARTWRDGHVKQAVIRLLLAARNDLPEVFSRGDYLPLTVTGERSEHIIAFARIQADGAVVVIVPRLSASLLRSETEILLHPDELRDLHVTLPPGLAARRWTNVLASGGVSLQPEQSVQPLLTDFPIAVLRAG